MTPRARPFAAAQLVLVLPLLGGCANRVVPPADVREPCSVYVLDYGYHAALLLPEEDGGLGEYAFGEWEWFARNQMQWYRGPIILSWPQPSCLGRRVLSAATTQAAHSAFGAARVTELIVERDRAHGLRRRLAEPFQAAAQPPHFNPVCQMAFVRTDDPYWLYNNCNSRVADWLRNLGCSVQGLGVSSRFEAVRQQPRPSRRQPE